MENTVKLAKADIVPTDTNLADEYACFADLESGQRVLSVDTRSLVTCQAPAT